jgi:hypothetical protein
MTFRGFDNNPEINLTIDWPIRIEDARDHSGARIKLENSPLLEKIMPTTMKGNNINNNSALINDRALTRISF